MNTENKVSIILTTTVHVTKNSAFQVDKMERINTYLKSIHLWLKKTDFNIIVVENSGYSFEELENDEIDPKEYKILNKDSLMILDIVNIVVQHLMKKI